MATPYNITDPYKQTAAVKPPVMPQINAPQVNRVAAASNPNVKTTPTTVKPMTFDANQTQGLLAALSRQTAGTASATDAANLKYATERGFKAPTAPAPTSQVSIASAPVSAPVATPAAAPAAAPVANPLDDRKVQLEALRKSFLESQAKNPDELGLEKELSDLKASYKMGNQQTQDQVIPMAFITGQQESLSNQYNINQGTLNDRLVALQNQRNSASALKQKELEFAQEDYKTESDRYKPQEIGGSIVQLNPQTGQYEVKYGQTAKEKTDKDMSEKGYSYVATPKERDDLKAKGYDIVVQPDGRTYAKPGATVTVKGVVVNKNTGLPVNQTSPTPRSSTPSSPTPSPSSFNEKAAQTSMAGQLKNVVGVDGYVSPDDYLKARNAWIKSGGNVTRFDTLFKGYRNPNNSNYITNKSQASSSTGRSIIPK